MGDQHRIAARRKLGAELRILREELQVSRQQLADQLGWAQSKISQMEGGRTRSVVADVRAILGALECRPRCRQTWSL